ncbi:MAG TPA: HIT domain-containing protein [Acidimicrobiales bacterium]|nr:HIT domain-containing protein [Acidimicrobiales bacterium]
MSFEQLWAGWRRDYVMAATDAERAGAGTCVFCAIAAAGEPNEANGVIWRDDTVFAVVNAYPYASGHLMVMPRRHVDELGRLTPEESAGLWEATRRAVASVEVAYDPDGINMGANLGRAAGAGIPDHLHLHVVPRWSGDTNFMTSVAGVRVMPESLTESWRRLSEAWPPA